MIHITNFDTDFKGRPFKDSSHGASPVYIAVGYGDNNSNGNPYLVGIADQGTGPVLRTVLIKNVEFIPTQPAT